MQRAPLCLFIALITTAAWAQERRSAARPLPAPMLGPMIDRIDADVRGKAAAVRRDAFIVSQIVAAVGELDDFQHTVALEKARDHIDTALRRARENPPASIQTFEVLQSERDLAEKAKQQGATADLPGLKRDMLKGNHFLQRTLFTELDDLRRDRQTLSDLQARLSSMTNDIDNALGEALGATFDYFRAGGQ
jgi:hypothetical protein